MKIIFFMTIPFLLFAQSYGLRTFIDHANEHNPMIQSKERSVQSKAQEVEAAKSDFWPTVDVGAGYTMSTPVTVIAPGQTASASAMIGMDLYDGGRRGAVLNAKSFEHTASLFEKRAFEKSVALNIINSYYSIKKYKATLYALQKRSKELQTQMERVKGFMGAGLSTSEELDRLRAAYDNNAYVIENTKLAIVQAQEALYLQSGLPAQQLKENHIREPKNVRYEPYEKSKILHAHAQAVQEQANAVGSGYLPQVNVSDQLSVYNYNDTDDIPGLTGMLPDHQNRLMLSVNMRLFDNGKMKKDQEALKYQKLSLDSQKIYADNEQRMNFRVALKRLKTLRAKLKSTQSALKAARSSYRTIKKKFEVGIVDNVTYLDALTEVTLSQARYKETLYDYEIAKSIYYFYAGKSPREYIR
jgi:outer membrane protein TolC